ncbi:hypothetical protein V2J09_021862 [Rumex salicifolius]
MMSLSEKVAGKSCTQKMKKKRVSERVVNSMLKKQKKVVNSDCESLFADIHKGQANVEANDVSAGTHDGPKKEDLWMKALENKKREMTNHGILLQKKAFMIKALEIFGRNSCLIARNLLNGLKTCLEMTGIDNKLYPGGNAAGRMEGDEAMGKEGRRKSRFVRRKGRVRRLKYTWKSATPRTTTKGMRALHQPVLLGRSDVSGLGAFLKNSVLKNEYVGEYTGELISHREANKHGKIYDGSI